MADRVIEYEKAFNAAHKLLRHLEDLIDAAGEHVHAKADALNKAEYTFFSYAEQNNEQSITMWREVIKCRDALNKSKNDESDIEKLYGRVIGSTSLIEILIHSLRPVYVTETIQEHVIPDLSNIVIGYLG